MGVIIHLEDHIGALSPEQIATINQGLLKKGIPTDASELVERAADLITEARSPEKILSDINK